MGRRRRRSARGASLGTPSSLLDEAPPSVDQEANWVVSGGGLAGSRPDTGPSRTVRPTSRRDDDAIPRSSDPDLAERLLTGRDGAAPARRTAEDGEPPRGHDPRDVGAGRTRRALRSMRLAAATLPGRLSQRLGGGKGQR